MLWADANVHRDIGDEKRYVLEVWVLAQVAFNWKIAQSNFRKEAGELSFVGEILTAVLFHFKTAEIQASLHRTYLF
jgi:hypothetical protein